MKENEQELVELDLEDILKEFGGDEDTADLEVVDSPVLTEIPGGDEPSAEPAAEEAAPAEAEEVQEALERFVLTIPEGHSIAEFEGEMEQFFIQNYGSKKGHPIIIYDTTADKFYERAYRVKEEATQLPYVTIL